MKPSKWTGLAVALAASFSINVAAAEAPTITKYQLFVPEKYYVAYNGANKADFPKGFVPGYGSGFAFKGYAKDGAIEFYGITDRGPNGDGPSYQTADAKRSSKFFLAPAFQPQLAVIRVKDGKAEVTQTIGLTVNNKAITGLPLAPGRVGSTDEVALSERFTDLGYDNNGLDTEAIALDKKGNFWVCDEYGPFIAQFNSKGQLLKKYAPGDGLPEVLKYRVPNRGFEGLTVTPGGKVLAVVQSPLDINGKTGNLAGFTRLVELDPATGQTKMYAYPVDVEAYKGPKDAKLGDIYAISDTKLLLIEQGKNKNKQMRNLIYLVDLTGATDLTNVRIKGQEPEFATVPEDLSGVRFASKKLLVDLRTHGWQIEKAEGITMLPDKKTIVVTNDNDFGITMDVADAENKDTDPTSYTVDASGNFTLKGKPAHPTMTVVPNGEAERYQQIWFITLPQPLQ